MYNVCIYVMGMRETKVERKGKGDRDGMLERPN